MDGEANSITQVKEELRERRRLAAQIRRRTMTPEEREIQLARRRQKRVPETEEKKEQRRMRDRLRRERQSRERHMDSDGRITQMNEEQKERRRLARQIRYRNMSAEEKEKLLARRRQRRRPETEQQKEQRKMRERLRRERQSKTNRHVSMREPGESNGEPHDSSSSRRGVRLTALRRQARAAAEPEALTIDFAEDPLAIGIPDTHFSDVHFLPEDFFPCENALEVVKAEENFSEELTFESQEANYTLEAIDEVGSAKDPQFISSLEKAVTEAFGTLGSSCLTKGHG